MQKHIRQITSAQNAEKLLGITVEQIRKDICILGKLHPEEQEDSEKNYMEKIQVHEQREWDFEYVHLKTGEKRWFHNIVMGSEVNGKRKYILVMSDRTSDWKMNQHFLRRYMRRRQQTRQRVLSFLICLTISGHQ